MVRKSLIKKLLMVLMILCFFAVTIKDVYAYSYLSDKAEIPVSLENTGARAICQTDDGYIWIGQFAGLNRYDSKELKTYNSYTYNNEEYVLENVRVLEKYRNKLFMVSSIGLTMYDNHKFMKINVGDENIIINDLKINSDGLLYITSSSGLYTYNTQTSVVSKVEDVFYECDSITLYNDNYYIETENGIRDNENHLIYESELLNNIYCYNDILVISLRNGMIYFYDLKENKLLDNSINLGTSDTAHKFIYSSDDKTLFAACEKSLQSIDTLTYKSTAANKLENNTKLVDLEIDYEGNLWIASYISGVSIITKSTLVDIMFDVDTKKIPESSRLIYAIEKYDNNLYLATNGGIYVFDLTTGNIDYNHPLVTQINSIMTEDKKKHDEWQAGYDQWKKDNPTWKEDGLVYPVTEPDVRIPYNDIRDVEIFKGKLYFATYGSGLFEYDVENKLFHQYRGTDINPADPNANKSGYYVAAQRCLKAFDNYLYIGTSTNSIVRFDGTNFIFNRELATKGQILYINESVFGDVTYVCSGYGIYTIDYDLHSDSLKVIKGIDEGTSGMLKFYQDGEYFFYNIYGRFFYIKTSRDTNNKLVIDNPVEIKIPFVNGSIVEINKVKISDDEYKYVLASEKQIYIIDNLTSDNFKYEFYDSSNGLKSPIKGNSSGCYDDTNKIYYFQSQEGVFAYSFQKDESSLEPVKHTPLKIDINSIKIDDNEYYGNSIKVNKNADRITFNLSVFAYKPNKGYTIYYKLDGVDKSYVKVDNGVSNISYTNLKGGNYKFHVYVLDEDNQMSNTIDISLSKTKKVHEHVTFIILIVLLSLFLIIGAIVFYFRRKMKQSLKRQLEYKKITLESIEAIARTIDAKDVYTNGHSRRVGYYSREIAKAMNLPEKEVENIFYTALLHDIGKIGIPLKIINKPARLDDEEFAIMKTHTTKGGKILKDISTIPGIVEGAMYHHEKYNGTGYPTGLKGEEIPLNARIICCADCFDAMATKRSYKEPCSKEYIISEFERCSGTQFDPEIAKVVIKLIEEDKFKTIIDNDSQNNDIISEEEGKDGE